MNRTPAECDVIFERKPRPAGRGGCQIFVGHFEDTLRAFELPDEARRELLEAVQGFHVAVVTDV